MTISAEAARLLDRASPAAAKAKLGTVERVIQLRDVSTGELLGATMTMGQLFTGVASLIREKELAAESAAQAPAEA